MKCKCGGELVASTLSYPLDPLVCPSCLRTYSDRQAEKLDRVNEIIRLKERVAHLETKIATLENENHILREERASAWNNQ